MYHIEVTGRVFDLFYITMKEPVLENDSPS